MKMESENIKVLIIVRGGVVQSIYSTDKKLEFDILDYDNEELKNDEKEEEILESKAKGMSAIY